MGDWSSHVEFYRDKANFTLRYEDLLKDSLKIFKELFPDTETYILKEIINENSFKQMKTYFKKNNDYKNLKFLRSGKSTSYIDELWPSTIKKINKRHELEMKNYNYL